jgi:D-alanyl-D-alanine carboxypeptidase
MPSSQEGPARPRPSIDRAAIAPIVALLDVVPPPAGTPLPLLSREELEDRFDRTTLAVVDGILHLDGPPPPSAPPDRIELPVPGIPASAWLSPQALAAWRGCSDAMRSDLGRSALVSSAYRSPVFQAMLVAWLVAESDGDLEAALRHANPPSRSEHCLPVDHALDLTTEGAPPDQPEHFAVTAEYAWMRERGGDFGFIESYPPGTTDPVGPEPWHWRAPAP